MRRQIRVFGTATVYPKVKKRSGWRFPTIHSLPISAEVLSRRNQAIEHRSVGPVDGDGVGIAGVSTGDGYPVRTDTFGDRIGLPLQQNTSRPR